MALLFGQPKVRFAFLRQTALHIFTERTITSPSSLSFIHGDAHMTTQGIGMQQHS